MGPSLLNLTRPDWQKVSLRKLAKLLAPPPPPKKPKGRGAKAAYRAALARHAAALKEAQEARHMDTQLFFCVFVAFLELTFLWMSLLFFFLIHVFVVVLVGGIRSKLFIF